MNSRDVSTVVSDKALKNSTLAHWLIGDILLAVNASYNIYTNNNTEIKEIKLPKELMAFQPAKASG